MPDQKHYLTYSEKTFLIIFLRYNCCGSYAPKQLTLYKKGNSGAFNF